MNYGYGDWQSIFLGAHFNQSAQHYSTNYIFEWRNFFEVSEILGTKFHTFNIFYMYYFCFHFSLPGAVCNLYKYVICEF